MKKTPLHRQKSFLDAQAAGECFFEAEKYCRKCSTKRRYVVNLRCVECQKRSSAKYLQRGTQLFLPDGTLPTSRRVAIEANVKFFRTDTPCQRGHFSRRYTRNGACVACISQAHANRTGRFYTTELRLKVPTELVGTVHQLVRLLIDEHAARPVASRPPHSVDTSVNSG